MRKLGGAVIGLYPRTWRERYGEEVRDLLSTRPVRLRTLADLSFGAVDAWSHRGLIPGGGRSMKIRIPAAALLGAGAPALLTLWGQAARDLPSLNATAAGRVPHVLASISSTAFVAGIFMAVLAVAPLLVHAAARTMRSRDGVPVVVLTMAPFLALPVGFSLFAEAGDGLARDPLGNAIAGGFLAPLALALALVLPAIARLDPVLALSTRSAGTVQALAAGMTAFAWLPSIALMILGSPSMSPRFLIAVAAGALCSLAMCATAMKVSLRHREAVMAPAAAPA
ncbi:hypothetical protein N5079_22610 [Planotetraspora sp. A-T 1434]|uniref:hypothetical protein n=1 Tax=Planotetraspora sp. A-T 1434 TaxID=2979219 RepID=UPI0021BE95FB|nr:hypothetical protein [Planotetraspora sp. A-T 1434]MCT9933005.1 hypothetical protein [Planotetraspora sp. A-T 1434]